MDRLSYFLLLQGSVVLGYNCGQRTNPVLADRSIRPFGAESDYCLYKRYSKYVKDQFVWLWPNCNPNHKSRRYKWAYDEETGLVQSLGSLIKSKGNPFCWYISDLDRKSQKLKIARCNPNDPRQKFDFYNGRIFLREQPTLCVGFPVSGRGMVDPAGMPLTTMTCYSNNFSGEENCENAVSTKLPHMPWTTTLAPTTKTSETTTTTPTTSSTTTTTTTTPTTTTTTTPTTTTTTTAPTTTTSTTTTTTTPTTTKTTTPTTTTTIATTTSGNYDPCPEGNQPYYPHPKKCNKYYQCSQGVSYLQTCGNGLVFNVEKGFCDWPYNVNCERTTTTTTTPTTTTTTTTTPTTTTTTTPTTTTPTTTPTTTTTTPTTPVTTTTTTPTTTTTTTTTTDTTTVEQTTSAASCGDQFRYNVIYVDHIASLFNIESDILAMVDACYNVINIQMNIYSATSSSSAFMAWNNLFPDAQEAVLAYAEANGAKILLSGADAPEDIESHINDGSSYGMNLAQQAVELGFHGVDFGVRVTDGNNGAFENGSMQRFMMNAANAARYLLPQGSLVTCSAQAPYMASWAGTDHGYTSRLANGRLDVDFVNIQYFNQGDEIYEDYTSMFGDNAANVWYDDSSVSELIAQGVPPEKIVVGKYLDGLGNNGYVAADVLNGYACEFKSQTGNEIGGFMVWKYPGTTDAKFETWGLTVNAECGVSPTTADTTTTAATTTTTTQTTTPAISTGCNYPFRYNVIYIDWKLTWGNIGQDIRDMIDACYNVINISFWVGGKNVDAALEWQRYSDKDTILEYAEARGAKLILSAGGATEHIENFLGTPGAGTDYGTDAANAALALKLHGVDFDLELEPGNNSPFLDGSFQTFIVEATNAARAILPTGSIITHAPQAPYLADWAGADHGYAGLIESGELDVDFLNVQFYNQGDGIYSDYFSMFGDNSPTDWYEDSSVPEMILNGVPGDKIVVGKYMKSSFGSSGYVHPITLNQYACQFRDRTGNALGGIMVWMYPGPGDSTFQTWGSAIDNAC